LGSPPGCDFEIYFKNIVGERRYVKYSLGLGLDVYWSKLLNKDVFLTRGGGRYEL
jgi:hypothetical protein